jgi:hypothetical protein
MTIEDVRQLLQKEMAEKGTTAVKAASGDGWEAHVKEHHVDSLLGIASHLGDISLEQIREERLAKYLK